jgi:hypothetical protein
MQDDKQRLDLAKALILEAIINSTDDRVKAILLDSIFFLNKLTFNKSFCCCGDELTEKLIGENNFSEISIGVCEKCWMNCLF